MHRFDYSFPNKRTLAAVLFTTILLSGTSARIPAAEPGTDWRDMTFGDWTETHTLTGGIDGLPDDIPLFFDPEPGEITVGSSIFLGTWEQDCSEENGSEPIEWVVLSMEGSDALVLSRHALECMPYSSNYVDTTWETSEVRAWLNEDFFDEAFTDQEKEAIRLTRVPNDDSQGNFAFDTPAGNDTEDYLFLLSCAEAETYLGTDLHLLQVYPNEQVKAQGAYVSDESDWKGCTRWWLRSPGADQKSACIVHESGGYGGILHYHSIRFEGVCVRPALRLDLSSPEIKVCLLDEFLLMTH